MQKEGWVVIGAAFLLFVCVLMAVALGAVGGDAVKAALDDADSASASSELRSTNVCVGLFNLGACTSEQTSTTTTKKATAASEASPFGVIGLLTVIVLMAVAAVFALFFSEQNFER